jgi:inhibitor of cysteine peptidase
MLEIDASHNGNAFTVGVGDRILLNLPENPSTGYRWILCSEVKPVLELEKDAFSPSGAAPGASGSRTLQFGTTQAGHAELKLECRRSWEKSAVETFSVSIHAKAG